MPILKNPKWERFAQARAIGKSQDDAYVEAGYKSNVGNAGRLNKTEQVQARIAEIQALAAERASVTIETLREELEEIRALAVEDMQLAAATSAVMGKAKLFGLLKDRVDLGGQVQLVNTELLDKLSTEERAEMRKLLLAAAAREG